LPSAAPFLATEQFEYKFGLCDSFYSEGAVCMQWLQDIVPCHAWDESFIPVFIAVLGQEWSRCPFKTAELKWSAWTRRPPVVAKENMIQQIMKVLSSTTEFIWSQRRRVFLMMLLRFRCVFCWLLSSIPISFATDFYECFIYVEQIS
jgi:hypothetical protein